jgi:transposase
LAPGPVVGEVARRADVGCGQIYRWRKEFCAVADGFAQVLLAPPDAAVVMPAGGTACGEPVIEVEFTGKVRVRIPGSVPTDLAAAVVKALSRR